MAFAAAAAARRVVVPVELEFPVNGEASPFPLSEPRGEEEEGPPAAAPLPVLLAAPPFSPGLADTGAVPEIPEKAKDGYIPGVEFPCPFPLAKMRAGGPCEG